MASKIVLSGLKSATSKEQCRYNVPTKNKCLPTSNQQTVAMSNTEDMEVNFYRGHGLQGTNENSEGHESRGNKGVSCGVNEKESEQL
jgi:hypothetical protein